MWHVKRRVGAAHPCSVVAGSPVTNCGLRTWQFVDAKAGDGSLAPVWIWGMAVHPPVTRLWPSARAAELGQCSLRWHRPLRLFMSAGGLAVHGAD